MITPSDVYREVRTMNIEALAQELAYEDMHDYVYGDSWMGRPDAEDPKQVQEYIDGAMPRMRDTAQRYADILTGKQIARDDA